MRSANDFYQHVMLFLRRINPKSPLILFLQKQSLSIMRGIHVADANKIKSMQILLNAALLFGNQSENQHRVLLVQLVNEIEENTGILSDEYRERVTQTQNYIHQFLYGQVDKGVLKEAHHGKPWRIQNNNNLGSRVPIGLKKPNSNVPGSGLIPTKNEKGWEFPPMESNLFTQKFFETVSNSGKKRILILGAGYGTSAYSLLTATKNNGSKIIVNDLSAEQMEIFKDNLPTSEDGQVTVIGGDFLTTVDFPDSHFDLILMENVIHFFTPEQVHICLSRLYGWLKFGGSVTVTAVTPYWGIHTNENGHIQIFEQKKAAGNKWPGFIDNLRDFIFRQQNSKAATAPLAPAGPYHTFDDEILRNAFSRHNFVRIQVGFFAMPKTFPAPFLLDGREFVGVVASKSKFLTSKL